MAVMTVRTPFVWSFRTACPRLDAALRDYIAEHGGELGCGDDRLHEFDVPLSALRAHYAAAMRAGCRGPAVGIRASPPYMVWIVA